MPKKLYEKIRGRDDFTMIYHVKASCTKDLFDILYQEHELYEFVMCLNSNQDLEFFVPKDVPTEGINETNLICRIGYADTYDTLTNEPVVLQNFKETHRKVDVYNEFMKRKVSYSFFVLFLLYMNTVCEEYGGSIFDFTYHEDGNYYEVEGHTEMDYAKNGYRHFLVPIHNG